ncbi:hypothetical protein PGTUg99_018086 [Puccinia graminis f. sp. tritici]|uniref:Uncharacterized protein n=1 Tax=Puccinia graminis f. sp. tritici TaxID=56615 RepID=A0A5B0QRT0_PUCGR|nr:hypothetical protein PGTUg99_018086 [Puccinia graminis f. sp. tritici]
MLAPESIHHRISRRGLQNYEGREVSREIDFLSQWEGRTAQEGGSKRKNCYPQGVNSLLPDPDDHPNKLNPGKKLKAHVVDNEQTSDSHLDGKSMMPIGSA